MTATFSHKVYFMTTMDGIQLIVNSLPSIESHNADAIVLVGARATFVTHRADSMPGKNGGPPWGAAIETKKLKKRRNGIHSRLSAFRSANAAAVLENIISLRQPDRCASQASLPKEA